MYFFNLSETKAVCRSVQQLKIVKIAVILLLLVQIIEAANWSFNSGQYVKWTPKPKSSTTFLPTEFFTTTTTKAAKTFTPPTTKSTPATQFIQTTKFTGADNYCSMCKSHVACKKNNVR